MGSIIHLIWSKLTGWDYLGKRNYPFTSGDVPSWVQDSYYKKRCERQLKSRHYGNKAYFKGSHYLYKVVVGWPETQGDDPTSWYKRKRTIKQNEKQTKKIIEE